MSRYRERVSWAETPDCTSDFYGMDGAVTYSPVPPAPPAWSFHQYLGRERSFEADSGRITDSVTPGYFKTKRDRGILAVNDLNLIKERAVPNKTFDLQIEWNGHRVDTDYGYPIWRWFQRGYRVKGGLPSFALAPPILPGGSFNYEAMLQKALADARSELWDMGTFIAEFHKTAAMVGKAHVSSVNRLNRIVEIMRRRGGRRRSFNDLLDEFSSMWMEGRYGWRILFYDIQDAQEALRRLSEGELEFRKRRTETDDTHDQDEGEWQAFPNAGSICPFRYRWQWDTNSVGRAGVGLSMDLSTPVQLDPIVTAYEVIPFSMVASWFSNIEDIVKAWTPFGVGALDYGFRSQRDFTSAQLVIRVDPENDFDWFLGSNSENLNILNVRLSGTDGLVHTREVISRNRATPSFNFTFQNNLSGLRIVDGTALAWLLRRKLMGLLRNVRI